jgi:hypothetical protein
MKHVKNLFGRGLEILSTAFPSQLLIKIDQAMKINFGEFIKTHSLRFSCLSKVNMSPQLQHKNVPIGYFQSVG